MSDYRPDIDGLRAIAVISILLFHAGFSWFGGGFVGVDVFFVISGFLITGLVRKEIEATGAFRFGHFYTRRARRLFPAMFATLTLSLIAGFLLLAPAHFGDFGGSLIYSVMSLSNFYFWMSAGYFDTDISFKPLLHTWSLSVEEQFYLVWPALIFLILTRWRRPPMVAAMAALTIGSLILNEACGSDPATIFYLAPFRVFEFAIGAAVVWLVQYRSSASPLLLELMAVIGLAMILYAVFCYTDQMLFPSYNALVPVIGTAMLIYAGPTRYTGLLLNNPLAIGIGLISYSLYLVHWPLIVFYRYYTFEDLTLTEKWVLCGAAIALAALVHRYIEQPFRRPREGRYSNPAFGLICALLAMAIVLPASTTWANGGWMWRANVPEGDISDFVGLGGGEGPFHLINYGGEECPGRECSSGPQPEKFVLIGDSHGRMYFEGLRAFSADRDIAFHVFESGACNFVSSLSKCEAKEKAAEYIKTKQMDTVVMSQSWMRSNYETLFFKTPKHRLLTNPRQFAIYYLAHLERILTVDYLAKVKRLVIIGAVPQFAGRGDALTCLTRPTYIAKRLECDDARIADHPLLERYREFNRLFAEGIEKFEFHGKEILFLDPFEVLCDNAMCRQIVAGRLVYSDDDHLSKFGSTLVIEAFALRLSNFINGKKIAAR